jgi:hypothetical protein
MLVRIGPRGPGWSWRRGARVWEGFEGKSFIWIRSPWRIATVWAAALVVLGLIGVGLCQ